MVLRETFIFWSATLQSPDPFYYPSASTTSIQSVVWNPAPRLAAVRPPHTHAPAFLLQCLIDSAAEEGEQDGQIQIPKCAKEEGEGGEKEVALRFDSFTCELERSLAGSRVCNERRCGPTLSGDRSSPRRRRRRHQRCFKGGAKRRRRPRKVIILRACARLLNAELPPPVPTSAESESCSYRFWTKQRGGGTGG